MDAKVGSAGSASIKEKTVTIRTLSVNNKQMTLSVFKQLPYNHEHFEGGKVDESMNYWGYVYREPKKMDDEWKWVIYESNGILYKCSINNSDKALTDHMKKFPQLFIAV